MDVETEWMEAYCAVAAVLSEIRKQQSMTVLLSEHETRFITIMTD